MVDALILSPHPDDAELAMGGTIARLVAEGRRVAIVDVTSGEPTPYGDEATRAGETAAANAALGHPRRENLALPNRWLEVTIANRKVMAAVIRRYRPKVLFIPFRLDAHPDHLAVHELGIRARFDAKLTKTDIPGEPWYPPRVVQFFCTHLKLSIQPTFLIDTSDHAAAKRRAIDAYQSQFYVGRDKPGEVPDMVAEIDAYFGSRIGRPFAEPFYTDEPIAVSDLDTLV
ncbi:MAG: bacillithiol biosynthesis deacetylase BshB1 [Planctomycetes bacterium]|nr:bacillithiol biosynthesis deacetylase BshB1 [Planctomycetota bacterium]